MTVTAGVTTKSWARALLISCCLLALALFAVGCDESDDVIINVAPGPPQGLHSITADSAVILRWNPNTEPDIKGYEIWVSDDLDSNPEDREYSFFDQIDVDVDLDTEDVYIEYVAENQNNGETRFWAVLAFDYGGMESGLSLAEIFDTPRPEGFDRRIFTKNTNADNSGFDFSANAIRRWDDPNTDMYLEYDSITGTNYIKIPDSNDILDAGITGTLDDIDFAPDFDSAYSVNKEAEIIMGHSYILRLDPDTSLHYAKFRVTSFSNSEMVFDWAYQIAEGNNDLSPAIPPGLE
jgi:hypothetical protein